MTLLTPARPASPARPERKREAAASTYWERLREPTALVHRDLALLRTLNLDTPLLDVGCGNGAFLYACQASGIDAIGAEAFDTSAGIAASGGATVLQAQGQHLPLATGSFDAVRLKEVFEHVQDPLVLAREMRRVLRTGGMFLSYVPTQWSQLYPFPANFYDDYTHVRAFSRMGLTRLLEDAGFTRIRIEGYTPPLRAWQRPVGALASRVFPFLWRAVAHNDGGGERHA